MFIFTLTHVCLHQIICVFSYY